VAYVGATSGITLWRPGRFELAREGLVGVGSARLSERDADDFPESGSCVDRVAMFVAEPTVAPYVHTGQHFRLGLKGGYRLVTHQAWRSPAHFDLSGGFGGLELQWGRLRTTPTEPALTGHANADASWPTATGLPHCTATRRPARGRWINVCRTSRPVAAAIAPAYSAS
jgi:hypothetical protein